MAVVLVVEAGVEIARNSNSSCIWEREVDGIVGMAERERERDSFSRHNVI